MARAIQNRLAASIPLTRKDTATLKERLSGAASHQRFAIFSLAVLAWNIPVILWGAYVRASFSGDGCGANWPFCNGQVIPQHMTVPTAIEFTHRMMTSVDSIAVIAMAAWAFLAFPHRHGVRKYATLSLVFLLIEALLGAGLVLLRYVARDQSTGRAVYLSAHLTNTLLLLLALTITAWLAIRARHKVIWSTIPGYVLGSLPVLVAMSITGAVAALGDMLFPARSFATGLQQDFSSNVSLLLRLRMVHPLVAALGAVYILWICVSSLKNNCSSIRLAAQSVLVIVLSQFAIGVLNVALLAPEWMQLLHLFTADLLWLAMIVLVLENSAVPEEAAFVLADSSRAGNNC